MRAALARARVRWINWSVCHGARDRREEEERASAGGVRLATVEEEQIGLDAEVLGKPGAVRAAERTVVVVIRQHSLQVLFAVLIVLVVGGGLVAAGAEGEERQAVVVVAPAIHLTWAVG